MDPAPELNAKSEPIGVTTEGFEIERSLRELSSLLNDGAKSAGTFAGFFSKMATALANLADRASKLEAPKS